MVEKPNHSKQFASTSEKAQKSFVLNVGIGTTNPQNALDLGFGAVNLLGTGVATPPTSLYSGMFPQSSVGLGLYSSFGSIGFWTGGTPTEVMRISGNKLGIGTTSPGTSLDVNGGIRAGSDSVVTTCNGANEGVQRYNYTNHAIEWCNGSSWISAQTGGTTATVPPPGMGGTGYFVLSASTWNGNLGGLSGANAKCRTELSTYNWKNKPGTLDTSKVFAFLCDGTTCNALIANTTYYYATANDLTAGGASFTTDSSTRGPNDNYQWNASNRFNTAAAFYSNRNADTTGLWNNSVVQAGSTISNCNNWSVSTNGGDYTNGSTSAVDDGRWYNTNMNCSATSNLICYVNP